jgi:hypothetical protein
MPLRDGPPHCVECGAVAPPTETAHTLIGPPHGWRLTRTPTDEGQELLEWRCAECWRQRKARSDSHPAPSGTVPPIGEDTTRTAKQ